jgi:hypothetical protein
MKAHDIIGFDIIGDVHGHADALSRLLALLGYRERDGVFVHAERRAVFVGDLIDRGPQQVATVRTVRSMIEAGSATMVLGNHEFNAIAYATPDPDHHGEHLRVHSQKNTDQHSEFLSQVGEGSALHHELIDWFTTIPMWRELSLHGRRARVIHACWHDRSIESLRPRLSPELTLTPEAVVAGSRKGSEVYEAIDVLLKGPEVSLGGLVYLDKDGHPRSKARLQWWNRAGRSLRDLALIPAGSCGPDDLPLPDLPDGPAPIDHVYAGDVPVFFGHYWRTGTPAISSPVATSVDFSVAKQGHLVAYRWEGEQRLRNDRFHAVHWRD